MPAWRKPQAGCRLALLSPATLWFHTAAAPSPQPLTVGLLSSCSSLGWAKATGGHAAGVGGPRNPISPVTAHSGEMTQFQVLVLMHVKGLVPGWPSAIPVGHNKRVVSVTQGGTEYTRQEPSVSDPRVLRLQGSRGKACLRTLITWGQCRTGSHCLG